MECSDAAEQWAAEKALTSAGYEVAVCDGPTVHQAPCPLVERGECALTAGADAVVNLFELSETPNQDVVRALRERRPESPVIVQARRPKPDRHAELVAGCKVVPGPLTSAGLVTAVTDTLAETGGSRV